MLPTAAGYTPTEFSITLIDLLFPFELKYTKELPVKKTFFSLAVICAALLVSAAVPDPPHMPKRLPKVTQIGYPMLIRVG